jgi:pilus assembly protein Flp/PilA
MHTLRSFYHDDTGATAIEYALLAALIAIAIVAAARGLGGQIATTLNTVSDEMLKGTNP